MTVVELNARLLREISYMADNEGYLQKTLDFITKLTKSKQPVAVRGQEYMAMLERLSDYQEFKKGWDGDDALPISTAVVKNFKKVLQKSTDSELYGWTIYPAANGTLLLQHKERKSGINIGAKGYSYYVNQNGVVKGENNLNRQIQLNNVLYDVKECPTESMPSHAGIFITVNGEDLIGGKNLEMPEPEMEQHFLLLAIQRELVDIAQKGLYII